MIQRILCYLKAVPFWLRTRIWAPHLYEDSYEKAIIICTDTGFRVSSNYEHKPYEKVYRNACLITGTCKWCGHKDYRWLPEWNANVYWYIPVLKKEEYNGKEI